VSHAPEGDWLNIAPLRILSFDIECAGRKGIFPEANIDPVIQIAAMVTRQGMLLGPTMLYQTDRSGENRPFVRNVFTLNTCAHIVGSQVLEFKDERTLLLEWRKFVEKVDPDMMIGYNISNFDLPYLLDRAKALRIPDFAFLGRMIGELAVNTNLTPRCQDRSQRYALLFKSLRPKGFESSQYGRSSAAGYPPGHAARLQASKLYAQCCMCTILGGTERGRTPLNHHRVAERYRGFTAATGGLLPESGS